jgi:hypothetical protein
MATHVHAGCTIWGCCFAVAVVLLPGCDSRTGRSAPRHPKAAAEGVVHCGVTRLFTYAVPPEANPLPPDSSQVVTDGPAPGPSCFAADPAAGAVYMYFHARFVLVTLDMHGRVQRQETPDHVFDRLGAYDGRVYTYDGRHVRVRAAGTTGTWEYVDVPPCSTSLARGSEGFWRQYFVLGGAFAGSASEPALVLDIPGRLCQRGDSPQLPPTLNIDVSKLVTFASGVHLRSDCRLMYQGHSDSLFAVIDFNSTSGCLGCGDPDPTKWYVFDVTRSRLQEVQLDSAVAIDHFRDPALVFMDTDHALAIRTIYAGARAADSVQVYVLSFRKRPRPRPWGLWP